MPAGRSKKRSDVYPTDSNRLVSALSAQDQEFFISKSTKIDLALGQVLMHPGDEIDFAYFPTKGVISLVTLMTSGAGAEVGLVGTEGMIGFNAVLGDKCMAHQALVQGLGEAYKIPIADLLKLCERSPEAQHLLLRYIKTLIAFVSQAAACNALHRAEARMARWILLVQDRLHGEVLPITHEFLANMLGIRRATVTVVANALEQEGLVALGRGEIKVLDRDKLIESSCECYRAISDATASLS